MIGSIGLKAGVMGAPVAHSLSPNLHNYWLKRYNIAGSYLAFEVQPEKLGGALRGLATEGFSGVNLTLPHKVAACGIVDMLDANAARIGAINLVIVGADGKLIGCNTDAYGFEENLRASGFMSGKRACLLGAGGACRAVVIALQSMGFTDILLANRTKEKAEDVARDLATPSCRIDVADWDRVAQTLGDTELLVNTTSLGMQGEPELDIRLDSLSPRACVADVVYRPLETRLLREAAARGNKIVDGLGMLLHQARPSFRAFFGRDPEATAELRELVLAQARA